MRDDSCGMGVPPVQKGRAGHPTNLCKLFNSRSLSSREKEEGRIVRDRTGGHFILFPLEQPQ